MRKGPKIALKQAKILDITLNSTSESRVLGFVRARLAKKDKFLIVTPHPEMIIIAMKDVKFAKILNSADLSIPDGIGLAAASKFLKLANPKNKFVRPFVLIWQGLMVGVSVIFNEGWLTRDLKIIRGRDLFLDLLKLANKKSWRVFLLGGRGAVAAKAVDKLKMSLKRVKIHASNAPELDENSDPISGADRRLEKEIVVKINNFRPHLLFVGIETPKQEKWLHKWLPKLNVGGAMAVGGTFDYIAGNFEPPPKWMEDIGLEWIWKLITGSKSFSRAFSAFPLFPLKVFWHKLTVIGP